MISLAEQCATESEFQAGRPPAGEAGMCRTECGWWKYWDGQFFYNGAANRIQSAWANFRAGQKYESHRGWRWVTRAELLAAGLTEAEALPMLHKSMLPQAAQDDEWLPWVKHSGGKCPLPADTDIALTQVKNFYGDVLKPDSGSHPITDWGWDCITAYRLKRTAKPPQAPAELWYPPVPAGFGPWVEHGEKPNKPDGIDSASEIKWIVFRERAEKTFSPCPRRTAGSFTWSLALAYCVRIEATAPIPEEDEEDGGELDIGAILEGLRKHFGGEAFAAAARPFKPRPGLLWTRDAADAVNAALRAREQTLKAQHEAMLRRDYE